MKKIISVFLITFALSACNLNKLQVYDLRCEYLTEPLGIDNPYTSEQMTAWDYSPRVAWKCKRQKAYRVIVALSEKDLKTGNNLLWDSGVIETAEQFCFIPKEIMRSHTKYYWRVETSPAPSEGGELFSPFGGVRGGGEGSFSTGLLARDWQGKWIYKADNKKEKHLWFRKSFELKQPPDNVFASVASSGYHELYINGAKADDRVLAPAVSRIDRRVLYVTYDISKFLRKGKNVIAVAYVPGWSMNNYFEYYGKTKQAIRVQVYGEGKSFSLFSDSTWLCSESYSRNTGRFDFMDMGGEWVDGRKYTDKWATPDFDDSQWENVSELQDYNPALSAQMTDFSRIIEEIPAKNITIIAPPSGDMGACYRVDMGKEFTGFPEAKFDGLNAGDTVVIQVSMRDSSAVYVQATDTVGNQIIEEQKQRQIYIARGENGETFRNRFNFFAGRYIHFRLKKGKEKRHSTFNIQLSSVKGLAISSAPEFTANFESSNDLYNAIFAMDKYTFQMNHTEGVVTDCPNRERLGYGPEGAYQTAWGLGLPCFNSAAYYVKNVRDWADVQRKDRRILEMALPVGIKWLGFLQKCVENDILTRYDAHGYFLGEWVSPGALHRKYYNAERQIYLNGDQVRTAWALYAGIMPDSLRDQQEKYLLELLEKQRYLNIGSFGRFPFYKTVLHSDKYAEIFGEILSNKNYPSYGYFLERNCTAFPEMWEIDQPNSTVIHTSYTGISAFFIKYLAGINEYSCGYDTLLIAPHPIVALEHCKAGIETPYGQVKSSWKRDNSKIKYRFEIPFGAVARIKTGNGEKIVPSGKYEFEE